MKPTPQKVNEALEAALTKAFTNLPDLMGDLERGRFQWPSSVIEWVQTETGISPEVNDPVLLERTDFEAALYFLLKERTGQTLEEFEAMGTADFLQLAEVAARIQRHRAAGDQAKTPPPKPGSTKTAGAKGKAGRKPYDVKIRNRDAKIYAALKNGKTSEDIQEAYNMSKREVALALDRQRKRVAKKRAAE